MRLLRCGVALLSLSSCLDLKLPDQPPPPGPGTLQGTLVYFMPGRTTPLPARGARVELLDSSNVVRADDDGRFLLGELRSTGLVRLSLDLDTDGAPDRQKLLSLSSVGAGPGRDVALGEVALGRNARLTGRVLRGDLTTDAFHLGTTVFLTGMEFSTFSADNGAWTLDGLPEGPVQVSFFRQGYQPDSREVVLAGGQEQRLSDVLLRASPSEAATVTGTVRAVTGDAVGQAKVRAVAANGEVSAQTGDDGRFSLGPLPSGAYLVGVERSGFVSASLGQRLLLAGANELGVIALSAGTSMPLPLDAGAPPPRVDAGADAGSSDAGSSDAGSSDAGSSDAGSSDAGSSDAGSSDAGSSDAGSSDAGSSDAGVDGGVLCGGLCAPGFLCDSSQRCRATGCESQSCALCLAGQCLSASCPSGPTCQPGDVCSSGACVPLPCVGVTCGANALCAGGACLPTSCSPTTPCRAGFVCATGVCTDPRCVGRSCGAGSLCVAGDCFPTGTPGNPCAAGYAYVQGRCREVACEGVTCGPGTQCSGGQCLSAGLYVAGLLRPRNIPGQSTNRYSLATSTGSGWVKLASFPEPIVGLDVSPDGSWLFLRTRATQASASSTTLYRSQDGRAWTPIWSGTTMSNGRINDLHVDEATGTLTLSLAGHQVSPLHRVMTSTDNGNTWALRWQVPAGQGVGIRNFAPPNLFAVENPLLLTTEGLAQFETADGGFTRLFTAAGTTGPFLISDRRGHGPTLLSHDTGLTLFLDGGVSGSFSAVPNVSVYGAAPSRQVLLLTSSSVARSFDHGQSWSFRSPTVASPNFTGLVRGADDALYLANEANNPPLLVSHDEGETWATVPTNWNLVGGLAAYWPDWQPNTAYGITALPVQPSEPFAAGFIYRVSVGGVSGATEPDWADAGSGVIVDGTVRWTRDTTRPEEMRPVAMVSRVCTPGQLRCGAGCVDIATDPQHCGACDRPCATTCVAGQCLSAAATDGGVSVGCADGTREGFGDVTLYPDVAACAGAWTGDLDVSTSASALCASGWHVCDSADSEVRLLSLGQATAFSGCFAFRASVDGVDGCEPLDCSNDVTHDDVAAVGASCLALSGVSRAVSDGGACFADRGVVASQCCSASTTGGCPQRGETGVVCCR